MDTVAEGLCNLQSSQLKWYEVNSSSNRHMLSSRLTLAHVSVELAAEELEDSRYAHVAVPYGKAISSSCPQCAGGCE